MAYIPKSEDQLAREGLQPDGVYDFKVISTSDKQSKNRNDMYTLKLLIWDANGNNFTLFDYIALGNNFGERKLRHAADACGLLSIYEAGTLNHSDFMNTTGKVELKTQEGNADYPLPKNVVKDYVKRGAQETIATEALTPQEAAKKAANDLNDEIPFIWLLTCMSSSGMIAYQLLQGMNLYG